jgi:hypothetical protein
LPTPCLFCDSDQACADKLDRELTLYGCPPVFPTEEAEPEPAAEAAPADPKDPTKFSGKKSKAQAKKGPGTTQYDILKQSGIPEEEIPNFRDTSYWLRYFPSKAMRDIKLMGCGVDWRRSFITTDVNPYYDSFVRWQFEMLKEKGLVVKDKRCALISCPIVMHHVLITNTRPSSARLTSSPPPHFKPPKRTHAHIRTGTQSTPRWTASPAQTMTAQRARGCSHRSTPWLK